ncbi:MAG: butyrate kinase [Thermodesulfobacteriota bacterium]|nr:butyrate kinase [Thermodesulfobacteriota bacterium]
MPVILVINIGSTSTKVGLFDGGGQVFRETAGHDSQALARLEDYDSWLEFHQRAVEKILAGHEDQLKGLDLIVSRGGFSKPLEGGPYRISEAMLSDLRAHKYGWHPCSVSPPIASRLAERFGVGAVIFDSPVADEMTPLARMSGLKGIERWAAMHVLSQKSAARKAARDLGLRYEEAAFIVAHLGGGITIGAHLNGRIIDGTHGLSEGPFTPQRTGALPVRDLVNQCFSGEFTAEDMQRRLFSQGGVSSYLGTHDVAEIERRVDGGDAEALHVLRAMGYQISKEIGAMAAVLEGKIDAVALTGDLCRSRTVVKEIQDRVSFLGPTLMYPGEDELDNLAAGGLSVLASDKKNLKEYG